MKQKCLLTAINLLLFVYSSNAQTNNSGIYMSVSDYNNHKLTYEIDCSIEKHKIRLNEFFNRPYITVIHNGAYHKLLKNEIYGFKDCNNKVYRFYRSKEYEIVETGKIIIYTAEVNVTKGKGFSTVHEYYFSILSFDVIKPLTINNVKEAFPNNHKFHDLLDQYFNGNNEVSEYDSFHKMYKINHLLESSYQH